MVSIKQISFDIGVSAATVSNALTGKGRVSKELAARIRARAEELGYRPSFAARVLKTGQSGILGLVMPDLTNPLFPSMARSLAIAADSRGLGVLIADSSGSAGHQVQALRHLVDRGVDGLIVVPEAGSVPATQPVPMAVINTVSDPLNAVSADHTGGGRQVGRHIVELDHRRVLVLGVQSNSEVQKDRIAGMVDAITPFACVKVAWAEDGLDQLPRMVEGGVTAILTTSDLLALRVQSVLARAGYVIPRDVSLTGFDDLPLAKAMHPALTTVAQDVDGIADRAIDIVDRLIRGDPIPAFGHTVQTRLVVRQSTSNANAAARVNSTQPAKQGTR